MELEKAMIEKKNTNNISFHLKKEMYGKFSCNGCSLEVFKELYRITKNYNSTVN